MKKNDFYGVLKRSLQNIRKEKDKMRKPSEFPPRGKKNPMRGKGQKTYKVPTANKPPKMA